MGLAQKAGALLVRAGKFLSHCLCCCTGACPSGISQCSPHCQCSGGQCVPCRDTACPNGQQECGPGCTCSGGQCVGCAETACPNGDECGQGCSCVDGACVPSGCCCVACSPVAGYETQAACEECNTTNYCYEYTYSEDPEASCPSGWSSDGYGGCYRTTTPSSCEDCAGSCEPSSTGPCGTWKTGSDCEQACNPAWCQIACFVDGLCNNTSSECRYVVDNYLVERASIAGVTPNVAVQWASGYPAALSCTWYFWVLFQSQNAIGSGGLFGTNTQNFKQKYRLYRVDCDGQSLVDITDTAVTNAAALETSGCYGRNSSCPEGGGFSNEIPEPPEYYPVPFLVCDNPLP